MKLNTSLCQARTPSHHQACSEHAHPPTIRLAQSTHTLPPSGLLRARTPSHHQACSEHAHPPTIRLAQSTHTLPPSGLLRDGFHSAHEIDPENTRNKHTYTQTLTISLASVEQMTLLRMKILRPQFGNRCVNSTHHVRDVEKLQRPSEQPQSNIKVGGPIRRTAIENIFQGSNLRAKPSFLSSKVRLEITSFVTTSCQR